MSSPDSSGGGAGDGGVRTGLGPCDSSTRALADLLVDPTGPLPRTDAAWESLLGAARRAILSSTLAGRLADAGRLAQLPTGPRLQLSAMLQVGARLKLEVADECQRIAQVLARAGLPCIALKGSAYLADGRQAGRGRLFGDVDLIVPRASIEQAEAALFGGGWVAEATDAYNQRYYRQWMHEIPPLQHVLRGSVIDLHHTITPPTSAFNVDGDALIAAARPAREWPQVQVLQPEDLVLHSAVHLFAEGEFEHGLRDLWDMRQLIHEFAGADGGFWQRLLDRADALALQVPLHHALTHVARLFGLQPPPALQGRVDGLSPGGWRAAVMQRLLATALEPTPPAERGLAENLERWLLYVRSHWLRMPPHLLVPHLVRKAWMRRFPEPTDEPGPAGQGPA